MYILGCINFVHCAIYQQNQKDYTFLEMKLNLYKMHPTTYKIAFCFDVLENEFRWLVTDRQNFTW